MLRVLDFSPSCGAALLLWVFGLHRRHTPAYKTPEKLGHFLPVSFVLEEVNLNTIFK